MRVRVRVRDRIRFTSPPTYNTNSNAISYHGMVGDRVYVRIWGFVLRLNWGWG